MSNKDIIADRIDNDFAYHQPSVPQVGFQHDRVRELLRITALDLLNLTPICREQSLMLTALEESMHWANAAIAKNQYTGDHSDEGN